MLWFIWLIIMMSPRESVSSVILFLLLGNGSTLKPLWQKGSDNPSSIVNFKFIFLFTSPFYLVCLTSSLKLSTQTFRWSRRQNYLLVEMKFIFCPFPAVKIWTSQKILLNNNGPFMLRTPVCIRASKRWTEFLRIF